MLLLISKNFKVAEYLNCEPVELGLANGGHARVDCLHTEFYLTRSPKAKQLESKTPVAIESSTAVESSCDASANCFLKYGRPDLRRMLGGMSVLARAAGQTRVAVLVCGPSALVNDVLLACEERNSCCGGVVFECHVETFEL